MFTGSTEDDEEFKEGSKAQGAPKAPKANGAKKGSGESKVKNKGKPKEQASRKPKVLEVKPTLPRRYVYSTMKDALDHFLERDLAVLGLGELQEGVGDLSDLVEGDEFAVVAERDEVPIFNSFVERTQVICTDGNQRMMVLTDAGGGVFTAVGVKNSRDAESYTLDNEVSVSGHRTRCNQFFPLVPVLLFTIIQQTTWRLPRINLILHLHPMQPEFQEGLRKFYKGVNKELLEAYKEATGEELETTKGAILFNRIPSQEFELRDQPPHIDVAASPTSSSAAGSRGSIVVMVALDKAGFWINVRAQAVVLIQTAFTNGRLVLTYTNSFFTH